jgi:hypothetical protein
MQAHQYQVSWMCAVSGGSVGATVPYGAPHVATARATRPCSLPSFSELIASLPHDPPEAPIRLTALPKGRESARTNEAPSNDDAQRIGFGQISYKDVPYHFVACDVRYGRKYSDVVDRIVTAFTAHVPGVQNSIGECTLEIMPSSPDCLDHDYATKPVVGVLNIDSWNREVYRGVGTLLMQAAIEYGLAYGTQGRLSLHSAGEALGFYYKLGMRNGLLNPAFDAQIAGEIAQAALEHRPPKDILDGDALLMYLPSVAIEAWSRHIHKRPVLVVPASPIVSTGDS